MSRRTLTNPEACAKLRELTRDLPPPRVIYAKPDGRERIDRVYRLLRSVLRRAS